MGKILVDDEDKHFLDEYKWFIKDNGYVGALVNNKGIYIHRLIMKAKKGQEIDHVNRNKLNNCKSNLRFSNRSLNMHNAVYKKGISGYIGVVWHTQNNYWVAKIRLGNGIRKHLGCFDDSKEAYLIYKEAKKEYINEQMG